jgi:hypothetical protein
LHIIAAGNYVPLKLPVAISEAAFPAAARGGKPMRFFAQQKTAYGRLRISANGNPVMRNPYWQFCWSKIASTGLYATELIAEGN